MSAVALTPTAADPLRGLDHLAKLALVGRRNILDLAASQVRWTWDGIAADATITLLAGAPGDGKTTLLFLVLAARANTGECVSLLGRVVTPAPPGRYVVIVEGEHAESSACRKLIRSLALLGIDDVALDRVILLARKAVRVGSNEWADVVRLVAAGLVSDIALDTIARVMPSDGSSEQEQVQVFEAVAQAIDAAPSPEHRPNVWAAAHTRKNGQQGDVSDVSGSTQRTGQADSVLLLKAERADGRVVATKVIFAKLREEPDDYPMPVSFSIAAGKIQTASVAEDERPLEARIVELLHRGPATKSALAKDLHRNVKDTDDAITNLFASRAIRTTVVTISGRERKAFCLPSDGARARDEHATRPPSDEHETDQATDSRKGQE